MNATLSAHRTAGGLLFLAGIALALGPISFWASFPPQNLWIYLTSQLLLVIALVLLAVSKTGGMLGQVALWIAAAGWFIITIAASIVGAPLGSVIAFGDVLAIMGGLAAGVTIALTRGLRRGAASVFLVAMVLAAVYLVVALGLLLPTAAQATLTLLLAAALVLSGALLATKHQTAN